MLIDTHAHVNFGAFKEDAESTVQSALDQGVWVVNVGTQLDTSREAVAMAKKFKEGVYAVVGIHPVHTYSQDLQEEETQFKTREEKFDYEEYKKLAQDPKVVGIGECGLDYFRLPENMNYESGVMSHDKIKQMQKESFIQQLKLAKELDKALVIHSRSSKGTDDACLDILEILKQELGIGNNELRFVLHSYTGSPEVAKLFVDLGAYVSFNGIITFDKTGNQEAVLKVVPNDKIILETDCPYLTPVPMRGKRNEPSYVRFVAEHVARLKGVAIAEMELLTTQNASKLFGFDSVSE
jgi:TatD DNase family protein